MAYMGYRERKQMKKVLNKFSIFWGVIAVYCISKYYFTSQALKKEKEHVRKIDGLLKVANLIILSDSVNRPIYKKLEEKGISTVAIYGMGDIGERIMESILLNSSIKILYGIDKRGRDIKTAIPVYCLDEALKMEKPEIVILTAYTDSNILQREIENKMLCQVITIGELLDE